MTVDGSAGAPPLESAAKDLREVYRVSRRRPRDIPLRAHFDDVQEWVPRVRARLQAGTSAPLEKVADWFLDNDYVIESALRSVRSDLPDGFYARLPPLEGGEASGLPRAFALARALLVASRLQLSLDGAVRFANAYQGDDEALTIAELWAFPTLLRIACLELLVASLSRLLPEIPPPSGTVNLTPASDGFDDADRVARAVANLRILDGIAWKDFFQRVSRVERVLAADPAGFYAVMDFETRDRYRRRVEELAESACCPETRIAERVVEQALAHRGQDDDVDHVGHWLIGEGAAELARALDCRPGLGARTKAALRARAGALYASALVLATVAAVLLPDLVLQAAGAGPLARIVGVAVAVLPASFVSLGIVHWLITLLVPPVPLPKLDFRAGIPNTCRTLVAMPVLVGSEAAARALVVQLEEHYLANLDRALDFALLTDWADAPQEEMPEDAAVLAALRDGIRALNARWGAAATGPFHLLHRKRRFNPHEDCWMGWERKRGKLEELNHLLAGEPSEAFAVREGDAARFAGIRFVITLDADTRLPPGAAQHLVGTLAHPLNTARFEASGRVARGYTVIQPRVETAPQAGNRTAFSRLFAGDTAIDIYTHAVSDVYQDLFGSGSFIGKGIYEVATFRRSLEGRVPEDALASHDLFEGAHGRAGLASDIVLYEGFPGRYEAYARRWHRWVRGDWQLLPWLGRRVPAAGGRKLPNRLSWLDRWKIVDNLRRSLLPASLIGMLVAGWLALPGNVFAWTALGLLAPGAAIFIELVTGVARSRRRGAVRGALLAAVNHAGHWFLAIAFLANDARIALDAIARTLWRMFVSRKRLLQWTAAADVEAELAVNASRSGAWRALAGAPAFALALGSTIALENPGALPAAAPLLLLWAASPELAFLLGRERDAGKEALRPRDAAWLRKLARRTWLYFETFVGPEDHWLPPDNLQERPHRTLAHRTSPTNVGMALLSTVAAADLGYLGLCELDPRLRNSLDTLERLPRHRGHLFNWYDTRTLAPLEPRYVSTVDSGNLAVSFVTVGESLDELALGPALPPQTWLGLNDALALLADAFGRIAHEASRELETRTRELAERAVLAAANAELRPSALAKLCGEDLPQLERSLAGSLDYSSLSAEQLRELHTWLERALHQAGAMRRESERLAPWQSLLDDPPPRRRELAGELVAMLPPTLSLRGTPERCERALRAARTAADDVADAATESWDARLRDALELGAREAAALADSLLRSAARARALAWGMDFRLLYDPDARRFRIGYNASSDRFDTNHYDLLASEARLASFFAIAKGDVPPEHWFHLGRPFLRTAGRLTLVSWGGSMFEYLMPPLFLRSESGTLLAQSERAAIRAQRRWARKLGIPWGSSESAFASFDPSGSYRYQSFGVPGLGLRRGLARDHVVAPYATALALPIRLSAALENLRALESLGLLGQFGFVDAADFTPERLAGNRRPAPVMTYMAHHQGMTLAALDNALCGDALVRRFHADLRIRTAELLLHERIPREVPPAFEREEPAAPLLRTSAPLPPAWAPAGVPAAPRIHALGNGRLASWTSAAGGGALKWQGLAVTRWRPDATREASGMWIYLRDAESGDTWSVGRQPTGRGADDSRATFHAHLVELHRREHGIAARVDIAVAHGDDVEIRLLTLANETGAPRDLIVTSYAEVALAPPLDDER
ncbi:MAG TPA: glucoamylase family protein, partial [Myxococcota bacterium]|nr:glucoamylase family protein [Myxococcota bacterium]